MKLINYFCIIDLEDKNEYFLFNTLYGGFNVITKEEKKLIDIWSTELDIEPLTEFEEIFYQQLEENHYLVNNSLEEEEQYRKIQNLSKKIENEVAAKNESVTFVLTYNCNFMCPYCFEKNTPKSSSIMTKDMVDRIYDLHNNNINYITFYGGEPLLLENKEIINYIISKSPKATFSFITNGYYLNEFYDIFSKIKIGLVQVTLDGTSEIHNQTRILKKSGNTYDKILEGIELYLKSSINIKIRINVSDKNLNNIAILCRQLKKQFVKYLNYLSFEIQPLFQLEIQKRMFLEDTVFRIMVEENNEQVLNTTLNSNLNNLIMGKIPYLIPKYTHCLANSYGRFYDSDGDIYSCILAVGNKNRRIGTYYPDINFYEHSMLSRNIESIDKCSKCKFAFLCGGGCSNAVIRDNDFYRPNCSTLKEELFYRLPSIYKIMNK